MAKSKKIRKYQELVKQLTGANKIVQTLTRKLETLYVDLSPNEQAEINGWLMMRKQSAYDKEHNTNDDAE